MRTAAILVTVVVCLRAGDVPKTLVSEDELEPIHSAIIRKEAWTLDPVRRLRANAEKHLKEGPWSVTFDRPDTLELDEHEYYSEAPYWWPNPENPAGPYIRKDGQTNPAHFVDNKIALNAMADAVFTLGAAAYFLDEPKYARRAARVIRVWFIDPNTRMHPDLEYSQAIRGVNSGRGAGIIDGRVFIRAIQGMDFLAQTGNWDARDEAAVRRWFEEYLHWLTRSRNGEDEKRAGNNHASWWTAQVAAVSSFVGNKKEMGAAFTYYRDHIIARQIEANGSALREESRTRSLWYSAFNLEAYTIICRIAQVNGVNLWDARGKGGATIATVIDYLEPYLRNPKKWQKEQINEYVNEGLYFLAFAGMGLNKPAYVATFRKLEKPEGAWLSLVDLIVGRWENAGHQTRH